MSPLWAEKKLVHFLSIWGPIILSHDHINSAMEKARALAAKPSPLFTVPGTIQQGSRFPSNAGGQDRVSSGVGSKRKGGKGTFFSMLVTFFVELSSPQLGRMENSDSPMHHVENNEFHHPGRADWLWLWAPVGEHCLAEWPPGKGKTFTVVNWVCGFRAQSPWSPSRASWGPLNVREPQCLLACLLTQVAGNH